jgi:hypothetical protein
MLKISNKKLTFSSSLCRAADSAERKSKQKRFETVLKIKRKGKVRGKMKKEKLFIILTFRGKRAREKV